MKFILPPLLLAGALIPGFTSAALIAHYDFTDGNLLDDEQGNYDLTEVVTGAASVGITPDGAASFPGTDGVNEAHLETAGPGGVGAFTVSFWLRTDDWTQGGFQGLFSNLDANVGGNFSWQIDSNGGTLRVVSATSGFTPLQVDATAYATDAWHHIVFRKTSSGAEFYVTALGLSSPVLVGSNTTNPGGLQNFRLGTNRNTDSLFRMDMANVQIYNDSTVSLGDLYAEGPMTIPEPSSLALLGFSCLGLAFRRRR